MKIEGFLVLDALGIACVSSLCVCVCVRDSLSVIQYINPGMTAEGWLCGSLFPLGKAINVMPVLSIF